MDRSRLIAWGFGLIVCLVVIMIGKGCTDNSINQIQKQKKAVEVSDKTDNIKVYIPTAASETSPPIVTDTFGRPVIASQIEVTAVETSDIEVLETTATDIFGNIVTTTENHLTDISGNTVTTTGNILTDVFGDEVTTIQTNMTDVFGSIVTVQTQTTVAENPVETTTLSPLEQYNEDLKNHNFMSGFNHGENEVDKDGNVKPTLPSDFVIIIE